MLIVLIAVLTIIAVAFIIANYVEPPRLAWLIAILTGFAVFHGLAHDMARAQLFAPKTAIGRAAHKVVAPVKEKIKGVFDDILEYTDQDLANATALADAGNDKAGSACWTALRGTLAIVKRDPLPLSLRLASDIERSWLMRQEIAKLKANEDCQIVCGRVETMVSRFSFIKPNFCGIIGKLL